MCIALATACRTDRVNYLDEFCCIDFPNLIGWFLCRVVTKRRSSGPYATLLVGRLQCQPYPSSMAVWGLPWLLQQHGARCFLCCLVRQHVRLIYRPSGTPRDTTRN